MTRIQAVEIIAWMQSDLWTKWDATESHESIWADVLENADCEAAKTALRTAWANSCYNTPRLSDYKTALHSAVVEPDRETETTAELCPLYVKQIESRHPRPSKQQRTSTWAYPQGLPDEARMLKDAEAMWNQMCGMYGGKWQIVDSRVTSVSERKKQWTSETY